MLFARMNPKAVPAMRGFYPRRCQWICSITDKLDIGVQNICMLAQYLPVILITSTAQLIVHPTRPTDA